RSGTPSMSERASLRPIRTHAIISLDYRWARSFYPETCASDAPISGIPMDRQKMKVKVCLVGEGAVGKTCLIRRFIQDQFDDRYISTLGAKVSKKEIKVDGPNGGMDVDMTIWDIMGEKGFRELLKEAYFHGAQGVLAVCDVTRKETLDDLEDWVAAVVKVTGNVPIEFLANKA